MAGWGVRGMDLDSSDLVLGIIYEIIVVVVVLALVQVLVMKAAIWVGRECKM